MVVSYVFVNTIDRTSNFRRRKSKKSKDQTEKQEVVQREVTLLVGQCQSPEKIIVYIWNKQVNNKKQNLFYTWNICI